MTKRQTAFLARLKRRGLPAAFWRRAGASVTENSGEFLATAVQWQRYQE